LGASPPAGPMDRKESRSIVDSGAHLEERSSFSMGGNEVDSDEIGVATQWKPPEDANCEEEQRSMQRLRLLPSAIFLLGSMLGVAVFFLSSEEHEPSGWFRLSLVDPVLDFTGLRKFPAWRAALPLLYVFAGYIFSNWLALCAQKRCVSYLQIDRTTSIFLQGLVKYAAMALAGSVILKAMGVEAVGLDALLASAGIAAGFASQKILQNLAAGVILLLFRPFKVGDKICVNHVMGWVTKIMLFETTLLTDDRRKISMPNHEIYSGYIDNLTAGGMRRVQVAMLVAGSADIAATRKALEEAVAKYAYLAEPKSSNAVPVRCTKRRPTKDGGSGHQSEQGVVASPSNLQHLQQLLFGPKRAWEKVLRAFDVDGENNKASMMGVLAVAMSLDLLKHSRSGLKQEQRIAQPCPPSVILLDIGEKGYLWRVHVWVPALEHDRWFVEVTEEIAKTLQHRKIKLASQAMERNRA